MDSKAAYNGAYFQEIYNKQDARYENKPYLWSSNHLKPFNYGAIRRHHD